MIRRKKKHFQLWRKHKMNFEFFFFLIFQFFSVFLCFVGLLHTSLEWSIPLHDPIQATNLYNFRGFFQKIQNANRRARLLEKGKKKMRKVLALNLLSLTFLGWIVIWNSSMLFFLVLFVWKNGFSLVIVMLFFLWI